MNVLKVKNSSGNWTAIPAFKGADSGGGGGGSAANLDYKWHEVGYMRDHYAQYQGWAQNVVFDPSLKCAVGIVISGPQYHYATNPWVRVTINRSGYMSGYEPVTVLDTDGETPYDPPPASADSTDVQNQYYLGSFIRRADGSYCAIDRIHNFYTSSDAGKTFVRQNTISAIQEKGSMFGLKELSNGRLIMGYGGNINGFWYSDDDGLTWTKVVPEYKQSKIGKQTFPEGDYNPFEPCFIDCGDGKVICYARKSTNAQVSGYVNSYERLEPAVWSVSTDYGTTWTAWENSATITDMTANNAKAVIVDGIVHMVFGSRYTSTNGRFRLFYTYASIEDAYADNWATPVLIGKNYWTSAATNRNDGGYPSLWADDLNNLYAVYYTGDGSGTSAGANWRLCTGAPVEKPAAVENGGGGALNVAYSQHIVDQKINKLMSKINYLFIAIGEPQEDSGEYDGSSVIMSGLTAWFTPGNSSKWEGAKLTSIIGDSHMYGAYGGINSYTVSDTRTPTKFENGFAYNVPCLWGGNNGVPSNGVKNPLSNFGLSSATEFTIEFINYSSSRDCLFLLKPGNGASNDVYRRMREMGGDENISKTHHWAGVFSPNATDAANTDVKWYMDGRYIRKDVAEVSIASMLENVPYFYVNNSYGYINDVRIYSRALTANEIKNNYLYSTAYIDFTAGKPTFDN